MTAIGLLGDATTTTALALASTWPPERDVAVVEADQRGGSLAAWLDVPATPSLSSIVAAVQRSVGAADDSVGRVGEIIDSMTRRAAGGLRFIPAPVSAREARRVVSEASVAVLPSLAAQSHQDVLVDLGAVDATSIPPVIRDMSVVVVVHHQREVAPRAAAVRLERLAESVEAIRHDVDPHGVRIVLAVIGDRPFDSLEIAEHVGVAGADVVRLSDDPLSASVLAGGPGISERRLRRQPLLRAARAAGVRLVGSTAGPAAPERPDDHSISVESFASEAGA